MKVIANEDICRLKLATAKFFFKKLFRFTKVRSICITSYTYVGGNEGLQKHVRMLGTRDKRSYFAVQVLECLKE